MKSNLNKLTKKSSENLTAKSSDKKLKYVIDASITGTKNLKFMISKLVEDNIVIILTSITVRELLKLEKISDCSGRDARFILGLAAEKERNFYNVLIDENFDTPDNAIVEYCVANKNDIILLTADREMTLNARMRGVNVEYIRHAQYPDIKNSTKVMNAKGDIRKFENRKKVYDTGLDKVEYNNSIKNESGISETNNKKVTLTEIFESNGKIDIICYQKYDKAVCVCRDGVFYQSGIKEIKIGDDVLIAKRHDKEGYITFSNFTIISLSDKKNAVLKNARRFYRDSDEIKLKDKRHIEFVKNFLN